MSYLVEGENGAFLGTVVLRKEHICIPFFTDNVNGLSLLAPNLQDIPDLESFEVWG